MTWEEGNFLKCCCIIKVFRPTWNWKIQRKGLTTHSTADIVMSLNVDIIVPLASFGKLWVSARIRFVSLLKFWSLSEVELETITNLPCFLLFFAAVAAAPPNSAVKDGGVVAKNLRAPVQCCEDDAVWALHSHLWCLQDHQRPGSRGSNGTGWEFKQGGRCWFCWGFRHGNT